MASSTKVKASGPKAKTSVAKKVAKAKAVKAEPKERAPQKTDRYGKLVFKDGGVDNGWTSCKGKGCTKRVIQRDDRKSTKDGRFYHKECLPKTHSFVSKVSLSPKAGKKAAKA